MNTSHVGVVILHVEYAKVLITVAVVTAHPSGNRNLYYTDGAYNFDSTKVEPLCVLEIPHRNCLCESMR